MERLVGKSDSESPSSEPKSNEIMKPEKKLEFATQK